MVGWLKARIFLIRSFSQSSAWLSLLFNGFCLVFHFALDLATQVLVHLDLVFSISTLLQLTFMGFNQIPSMHPPLLCSHSYVIKLPLLLLRQLLSRVLLLGAWNYFHTCYSYFYGRHFAMILFVDGSSLHSVCLFLLLFKSINHTGDHVRIEKKYSNCLWTDLLKMIKIQYCHR